MFFGFVLFFHGESNHCSLDLTGIHFTSLGPRDRDSTKLWQESLCRGSVSRTNWPLVQYEGPCCVQRKRRAWLAVGAGPGMVAPMLRPPPCLWQTRQWIISSSGTQPSTVGLRGNWGGGVLCSRAEDLPPLCAAYTTGSLWHTCWHCSLSVHLCFLPSYSLPAPLKHHIGRGSVRVTSTWPNSLNLYLKQDHLLKWSLIM